MWEELKVYKQLDKKDINPTFKKFGKALLSHLDGYIIDQTSSMIKISRQVNQLEQAVFIGKSRGSYELQVRTSIKPLDFYRRHIFTMLNIVPLGDIMNNYRRTFYPLTQEWNDLAFFLATRIKAEVEEYFQSYNSYEKIIERRMEIEAQEFDLNNNYELLIYAAIKTRNQSLLLSYLDKKISKPVMPISHIEYLKPESGEINEAAFLQVIKKHAHTGDFASIEKEIEIVGK
ncbi:hypothetical protein A3860_09470 [Niastella vici]|uniref:Uncharacterized protein n=1 Tax=Niastella vici TaxID=1703345 RepID=A0A1V9FEL9_9BACT|nr:hypothetical protein [Niastella vici]OQP56804.1 hypothetical protein A3860_09470 [Niastella vici]